MRLVTYLTGGQEHVGVVREDGVADTGYRTMAELVRDGQAGLATARRAMELGRSVRPDRILAPLRPGKMLGSGLNYSSHLEEEPGAKLPVAPRFFVKLASAIVGPEDPIVLPHAGMDVDYEVELVAVIGRRARRVAAADAMAHVFGYTLVNDVSARAIQFTDANEDIGKNPDSFAPMGPVIATADAVPDLSEVLLEARVNGELRQSEPAGNLRFDPACMIEWLSTVMTLEPGDMLTLGTPAGCGTFRDPPLWLQPGDRVTISATGVGELTNPVVAGPDYDTPWSAIVERAHREP